jgi:hypothetical protein
VSRDFRPTIFFHQTMPLGPTSLTKAFSLMASNSPRYSIQQFPKSASTVSMRPRKPTFFSRVPLYYLHFLLTMSM